MTMTEREKEKLEKQQIELDELKSICAEIEVKRPDLQFVVMSRAHDNTFIPVADAELNGLYYTVAYAYADDSTQLCRISVSNAWRNFERVTGYVVECRKTPTHKRMGAKTREYTRRKSAVDAIVKYARSDSDAELKLEKVLAEIEALDDRLRRIRSKTLELWQNRYRAEYTLTTLVKQWSSPDATERATATASLDRMASLEKRYNRAQTAVSERQRPMQARAMELRKEINA